MSFLNETGLATFLSYLKAWARSTFASKTDTQTIEGATTFSQTITGNISGSAGSVAWSGVTGKPSELSYLTGVTSSIQTQLNEKLKRGSIERIEGTSSNHKNLNDYTSAGFYNVKTQVTDNCPSGIGIDAVLLVYPWDSGSYLTQEITESAASGDVRRWLRKKSQNTWSAWKPIVSVSESGTGYIRFSTGLQLCFETVSIATGSSTSSIDSGGLVYYGIKTVTFPKAFSSVPVLLMSSQDGGTGFYSAAYTTLSATQVDLEVFGRAADVTCTPGYLAIGSWS